MEQRMTARLALAGATATLVFPLLVVALQVIQRGDYSPMRQTISELALGRAGWLMAVAFCSLAVGSALLTRLMHQLAGSRAATTLLGLASALTALSAFVHADGDTVKTTLHGAIHQVAGIVTFISIIVAMFTVAPRLCRRPGWRALGTATRIMAVAGIPAFFLVPVLGPAHMGLAQRVLVGLLLTWNVSAQLYAHHVLRGPATREAAELVTAG